MAPARVEAKQTYDALEYSISYEKTVWHSAMSIDFAVKYIAIQIPAPIPPLLSVSVSYCCIMNNHKNLSDIHKQVLT